MKEKNTPAVVCFGESLWDIFSDGDRRPGGAPMNVAYHLHQLSINSQLISSVGEDELGEELLRHMGRRNIPVSFCQIDANHSTGTVLAQMDGHSEMSYDIVAPVAWDFIRYEERFGALMSQADAFVFGSLAARNPVSRNTLETLMQLAKYKVFDINLRAPHYTEDIILSMLATVDLLKLNQHELKIVGQWIRPDLHIKEDIIKVIQDKYAISGIILTEGENGASYYGEEGAYKSATPQVQVADTVGSGDAFLAAFLSERLKGNRSVADVLQFATSLAAFVASQKGACPEYIASEILKRPASKRMKS